MQNGSSILERRLTVSYKSTLKKILNLYYSNPTSRYLMEENEKLCSSKNLYVSVYSGFIHDLQKLQVQMSFIWWMNQQLHWTCAAIKRNKLVQHGWISPCIVLSEKKPDSKLRLPSVTFWKRSNGVGGDQWCLVEMRWWQKDTRGFWGVVEIFCTLMIVVVTQPYVFVRMYRPVYFEQILHERRCMNGQ